MVVEHFFKTKRPVYIFKFSFGFITMSFHYVNVVIQFSKNYIESFIVLSKLDIYTSRLKHHV